VTTQLCWYGRGSGRRFCNGQKKPCDWYLTTQVGWQRSSRHKSGSVSELAHLHLPSSHLRSSSRKPPWFPRKPNGNGYEEGNSLYNLKRYEKPWQPMSKLFTWIPTILMLTLEKASLFFILIKAYQEMALEMTMVKGLTGNCFW
jgi:hypothetical protein